MITWKDGLELGPDGPCRQIPEKYVWSSSVWCTQDGIARRRFYNAVTKRWTWAEAPLQYTVNEVTGEAEGFYVGQRWMSIDRAIATTWLRRAPDSSTHIRERVTVQLVDSASDVRSEISEGPNADNLMWSEPESDEEEGKGGKQETWKPLKYSCGLAPCSKEYKISSTGRLKSPSGKITKGFWWEGNRWAAVKGAGLVNLSVASGLQKSVVELSPRIHQALEALMAGASPQHFADDIGVQLQTGWNYYCQAAQHAVNINRVLLADVASKYIPKDLDGVLKGLKRDKVIGGNLTDLMDTVLRTLPSTSPFRRSEFQFEMLRFARLVSLALPLDAPV